MKDKRTQLITINSISQLYKMMGLGKPEHPSISLINYNDRPAVHIDGPISFITHFYVVMLKRNVTGKIKYGQRFYDFDEGIMAFIAPGQMISIDETDHNDATGWLLVFHPDFISQYHLAKTMKEYGFFSYAVNEALHLSEKEEKMLEAIMKNIQQEYHSSIDQFSQDVMISHLDLLLNYSNRFYNRQFLTRKTASNDLLVKLDHLLTDYFNSDKV